MSYRVMFGLCLCFWQLKVVFEAFPYSSSIPSRLPRLNKQYLAFRAFRSVLEIHRRPFLSDAHVD